ncbi:small, acid-soluble spore protein, H family [Petroclostridium sp. X23]|uniref:small, acid-soluble spore protein, H family n=1 Tax=Petroclostridium sp. X23 TaxID=3045146 RepID=UPI0024ACE7BB|nr:small, acid-soluble spore protein, H family [Petroclostridium sp. X23]WHH61489.1 small, acid-soluble spore protein, H family [Petroclostridium sp. X23]
MRFERAKEIFLSPSTIEVLHGDDPVWITRLDSEQQSVEINNLTSDTTSEVPASELSERTILS